MKKKIKTISKQNEAIIISFAEYANADDTTNVIKSLKDIIGNRLEDTGHRVKAIELYMSYVFGKPKEQSSEPPSSKPFLIEHNIISIESVNRSGDDRSGLDTKKKT